MDDGFKSLCLIWTLQPVSWCSTNGMFSHIWLGNWDYIRLEISVAGQAVDCMSAKSTELPLVRLAPRTPIIWQQTTKPETTENPMSSMKVYNPFDAFAASWLLSCLLSCAVQLEICPQDIQKTEPATVGPSRTTTGARLKECIFKWMLCKSRTRSSWVTCLKASLVLVRFDQRWTNFFDAATPSSSHRVS